MAKCYFCGEDITFIKTKEKDSSGKTILLKVQARAKYFIPDSEAIQFIDQNGKLRTGRVASDGVKGWYPHNCIH